MINFIRYRAKNKNAINLRKSRVIAFWCVTPVARFVTPVARSSKNGGIFDKIGVFSTMFHALYMLIKIEITTFKRV